jgi:hypothetical protein
MKLDRLTCFVHTKSFLYSQRNPQPRNDFATTLECFRQAIGCVCLNLNAAQKIL